MNAPPSEPRDWPPEEPCPFCGSHDLDIHRGWFEGSPDQLTIQCRAKDCGVLVWCSEIDAWDRRHALPPPCAVMDCEEPSSRYEEHQAKGHRFGLRLCERHNLYGSDPVCTTDDANSDW